MSKMIILSITKIKNFCTFVEIVSIAMLLASLSTTSIASESSAGGPPSQAAAEMPPLLLKSQGSFFIGGRDVHSDTLSTFPMFPPVGTVTVDQMYVHYQIPARRGNRPAIVLIHGCCLTGASWEETPDGRMGWDDYFVRHGYPLYEIDQSDRGRSATDISNINAVRVGKLAPENLPKIIAASHESVWSIFRFGPSYLKVNPGLQFPLDSKEAFWKQMVPDWSQSAGGPTTVSGLSQLSRKLGSVVLIGHSQSGIYPFRVAQVSSDGIDGIVSIEPGECPDPTSDTSALRHIPILIVYGDFIKSSSFWAPRAKSCRAFVNAVNRAGGHGEVVELPDVGIHGNSHMMMLDRNNLQVADWLMGWIDRNVTDRKRYTPYLMTQ